MIANIILGWFVPVLLFIGGFYLLKVYRDDTVIKWVKLQLKRQNRFIMHRVRVKKNLTMLQIGFLRSLKSPKKN